MRHLSLLALLFLRSLSVHGQENALPTQAFSRHVVSPLAMGADTPDTAGVLPTRREGRVDIVAAPRVEQLMKDYAERKHPRQGYRVQVFLGDRRTAEETKRAFLLKHPEVPVYLSWLAPNFRLRVGDLRTRLEAERLLRELRATYPGSYIVQDEIEPPALPGTAP